jgi:Cu-processing system ATP-binding protein
MPELRRLADLPVRMRLTVNGAWTDDHARVLARSAKVSREGAGVTLTCPAHEKMAVVRELAGFGPAVIDLQIQPPSLDDLYAHFLREGAPS